MNYKKNISQQLTKKIKHQYYTRKKIKKIIVNPP
jgi:hypothetical protein